MNYRAERLPIVTFSLIGINTLVYLVSLIFYFNTQGESEFWIREHLWLIPAQSLLWTYFTSMFVHAGIFHLVGNMLFLFLFGSCVEDIIGRWRFLGFYLVGGFVADLTYIAMTPDHFGSTIPMGGASGAISACMGMYLLLRADADIEFKYFFWLFVVRAGEFELPAWIAITFWFLNDLLGAILGMVNHQSGGGVAFGAHVGGLLAGLAMAGIYKWTKRQQEPEGRKILSVPAPVPATTPVEIPTGETPTIYLHDGGVQSGPFTLPQIQAALSAGAIGPDAVYWSEGMTDWQNVLDLVGGPLQ
jgi:membrane associated rhomboid family serine protease